MNYEKFYLDYLAKEKEFRSHMNNQQKCFRRLVKEMEDGDIKNAQISIAALQELSEGLEQASADMLSLAQGFDINEYILSGEFAQQMLECCKNLGIDAKEGENGGYELFPYKVRLDGENAEVILDKKKTPYLRPQSLVKFIKEQRDRLMDAAFNPSAFLGELAQAYDLALIVQAKEKNRAVSPEGDVYLLNLYKYLTPMKRFRRDYDLQNFAFDISRLFSSEIEENDDGRKFQFGPSRKNEKALRVLDKNSKEQFLATVRFFKA